MHKRQKRFVLSVLVMGVFFCSSPFGLAAEVATAKSAVPTDQILEGGVYEYDLVTAAKLKKSGIRLVNRRGVFYVDWVSFRSKAFNAGVKREDRILSASVTNDKLLLAIIRDDKKISIAIDMREPAAQNIPSSRPLQSSAASSAVVMPDYIGMLRSTRKKINRPPLGGGGVISALLLGPQSAGGFLENKYVYTDSGNRASYQKDMAIYQSESSPGDLPFAPEWGRNKSRIDILGRDFKRDYWPKNLSGFRSYHLVFNRNGTLVGYYKVFRTIYAKPYDEKLYDRLCLNFISLIGQKKLIQVPRQSRVNAVHVLVGFP